MHLSIPQILPTSKGKDKASGIKYQNLPVVVVVNEAHWFWPMALRLVGAVHQLEVKTSLVWEPHVSFRFIPLHLPDSKISKSVKQDEVQPFHEKQKKANKLVWKIHIFLDEIIWIWPNYNKSPTYISLKKGGFHGFPFLRYIYNRYTSTRWISATLATFKTLQATGNLEARAHDFHLIG